MEKYINDYDKECYKGVDADTLFSALDFHTPKFKFESDVEVALHTNLGSLTVLDRLTGYSENIRDVESGFRDPGGEFWLASGGYDVRECGAATLGEAIQWIKNNANTCNPDRAV